MCLGSIWLPAWLCCWFPSGCCWLLQLALKSLPSQTKHTEALYSPSANSSCYAHPPLHPPLHPPFVPAPNFPKLPQTAANSPKLPQTAPHAPCCPQVSTLQQQLSDAHAENTGLLARLHEWKVGTSRRGSATGSGGGASSGVKGGDLAVVAASGAGAGAAAAAATAGALLPGAMVSTSRGGDDGALVAELRKRLEASEASHQAALKRLADAQVGVGGSFQPHMALCSLGGVILWEAVGVCVAERGVCVCEGGRRGRALK